MYRPTVIVNCAMSADGKIALPSRNQLRISSVGDMRRVFVLRNECDAVLVGIGAVLADDPKLTVKEMYVKHPRNPIRVVLDTHARTPLDAFVVNEQALTILFTGSKEEYAHGFGKNVEVISSKIDCDGLIDLPDMLSILYEKGIRSLLVEGGGTVIWSFLKQRLVDDLFVYVGPMIVGGRKTPTMADGDGVFSLDEVIHLVLRDVQRLDEGVLLHYQLKATEEKTSM